MLKTQWKRHSECLSGPPRPPIPRPRLSAVDAADALIDFVPLCQLDPKLRASASDQVYKNGFGGKVEVCAAQVVELMEVLQKYCEHSINANQTDTGLFHAYNILVLGHDDAKVRSLPRPRHSIAEYCPHLPALPLTHARAYPFMHVPMHQ